MDPRRAPAPTPNREQALDAQRVAAELAAADLELEAGLDLFTPDGVARALLVLELVGPIKDPGLAAWVDVLRVKLRRAKLAGRGAFFASEVEAPAEAPAAGP